MYNKNIMVPRNIMLFDPVYNGQTNYIYRTENRPNATISIQHRAMEPRRVDHFRLLAPANSSNADVFAEGRGQ